ncbi:MAG: hypothetical protein IV107_19140 [Paucibacter sp.]|nr:hypothetical protein [Roseateles sp.]
MTPRQQNRPFSAIRALSAVGLGLALLLPAGAQAADAAFAANATDNGAAGKSFMAGIKVQEQAKLQEIGLPAYPGAVAQQDDKDDKPGVTVGLSFGPFAFKLLVSKFASADGIDKISDFYRAALSQHGPVLDCSHGSPAALAAKTEKKKDAPHGCAEISGDPGERVYKTGAGKSFRLVSLKQVSATEVHFQMVRMELRGF